MPRRQSRLCRGRLAVRRTDLLARRGPQAECRTRPSEGTCPAEESPGTDPCARQRSQRSVTDPWFGQTRRRPRSGAFDRIGDVWPIRAPRDGPNVGAVRRGKLREGRWRGVGGGGSDGGKSERTAGGDCGLGKLAAARCPGCRWHGDERCARRPTGPAGKCCAPQRGSGREAVNCEHPTAAASPGRHFLERRTGSGSENVAQRQRFRRKAYSGNGLWHEA
jgi:hypothetical protein